MNSHSFKSKEEAEKFAEILNEKGIFATLERISYWDELNCHAQWIVIWSCEK